MSASIGTLGYKLLHKLYTSSNNIAAAITVAGTVGLAAGRFVPSTGLTWYDCAKFTAVASTAWNLGVTFVKEMEDKRSIPVTGNSTIWATLLAGAVHRTCTADKGFTAFGKLSAVAVASICAGEFIVRFVK